MEFSIDMLPAESQNNFHVLMDASRKYRDDGGFRARLAAEPRAVLEDMGMSFQPPEVEVQVSANTEDVFHVIVPVDPNVALADESMQRAVGGSSASTAATAGSASTLGCLASCASSGSSASSVGSAGSAS